MEKPGINSETFQLVFSENCVAGTLFNSHPLDGKYVVTKVYPLKWYLRLWKWLGGNVKYKYDLKPIVEVPSKEELEKYQELKDKGYIAGIDPFDPNSSSNSKSINV